MVSFCEVFWMNKIFCVLLMALSVCGICAASPAETGMQNGAKIAVVQYLNSSEEKQGYVDETVTEKYTNYFSAAGYMVVPNAETQSALSTTGYTTEDEELPDKDQMKAVAEATGADYVVAMEIAELHASRHESFFQVKVTVKTKLAYKDYAAKADKLYAFKTTSSDDNKTVFGGVGFKSPIVNALTDAMEKGNAKIQSFVAENSGVDLAQ